MYIGQIEIGDTLYFNIQLTDTSGTPTDPDVATTVDYDVYENTTDMSLSSTLSKIDTKTGFYGDSFVCTSSNGFETGKSYTIRITGTVDAISKGYVYHFRCVDTRSEIADITSEIANMQSDLSTISGNISNLGQWIKTNKIDLT